MWLRMANGSLSIGKIYGIEIELHWTFILLILFTLLISTLLFVLIILLFVCVLIHELAHSVTSLKNRISVKRIVLLPIGGASIIDTEHIDPRVEFNIAIAGPIMSLVLGGIFGMFVIFTPPGTITQIFQFLFEINILLGVFNILPAFPMDGGRVLRSYLERRGNYFDATMKTIKASNYVMALIIIGTIAYVAVTGYSLFYKEFIVLWDLIIVMFLYSGAQGEKESVIMRKETQGMRMSDIMTKRFLIVKPDETVSQLYSKAKAVKEGIIISRLGNQYFMVNVYGRRAKKAAYARDLLIPIPSVKPNTQIFEAMAKLGSSNMGVVVVEDRGRLLGIATSSQLHTLIELHLLSKKSR